MNRAPESYKYSRHRITLITGPMFAGKTQELLGKLKRHEAVIEKSSLSIDNNKILIIGPSKDNRGEKDEALTIGPLTTHRKHSTRLEGATEMTVSQLSDISEDILSEHSVIGIDECQFFDDLELLINWSLEKSKIIYAAGLLATSEGLLFGKTANLLPFSVHIQLYAVCEWCYERHGGVIVDASMTQCLIQKDGIELIGSSPYKPVCFRHWSANPPDNNDTSTQ